VFPFLVLMRRMAHMLKVVMILQLLGSTINENSVACIRYLIHSRRPFVHDIVSSEIVFAD
jgi:hypothetical protein